jgi:aspartyl-tRNA(Asn)/glutamyl-tRNA(Gln) amidotransferase subunit C
MITKDEVQKLADLAHLAVAPDELERIAGEMDAILGYVSEIDTLSDAEVAPQETLPLRNVMREDVVHNEPGMYTEAITAQFPARDGDLLRVKKIL